jgi:hypothetical protein
MDPGDEEIILLWESLEKNNVEYLLVGGFAVNLHGFARFTADLDLWIKDSASNRKKLHEALKEAGLGDLPGIETMQFIPGWSSFSLPSGFQLDLMTSLRGFPAESFDECYKIAPTANLYGVNVKFLHYNQLLEAKKAAARPKDLIDIEELKRLKE